MGACIKYAAKYLWEQPDAEHALFNTGFADLTFIVVTSPPQDH